MPILVYLSFKSFRNRNDQLETLFLFCGEERREGGCRCQRRGGSCSKDEEKLGFDEMQRKRRGCCPEGDIIQVSVVCHSRNVEHRLRDTETFFFAGYCVSRHRVNHGDDFSVDNSNGLSRSLDPSSLAAGGEGGLLSLLRTRRGQGQHECNSNKQLKNALDRATKTTGAPPRRREGDVQRGLSSFVRAWPMRETVRHRFLQLVDVVVTTRRC